MAADRSGGAVHHPSVRSRPLLLVTALYAVAAFVATLPAVLDFRSAFLSTGLPGYGEAASGDHLQTTYRFWLVGHQLEQGGAALARPLQLPAARRAAERARRLAVRLPLLAPGRAVGPVVAWNLLLLGTIVAAGVLTFLWLRELELPATAAVLGGLAFAVAPYRLVQSGGHLLGWAAVLPPARALGLRALAPRADPGARRTPGEGSPPPRSSRSRSPGSCTSRSGRSPSSPSTLRFASADVLPSGHGRGASPGSEWGWPREAFIISELVRVRGPLARGGGAVLRVARRSRQPLAPARARALRLPRLADRRARAWPASSCSPAAPARPRRRSSGWPRSCPALLALGTNLPVLRGAPGRLSTAPLPARPRSLPAARQSRPRGARRRRLRGPARPGAHDAPARGSLRSSSRSWPPTCSSFRCARALPIPTTERTRRSTRPARGGSSGCRSSSAAPGSSAASTSTTRCRRRASARPATRLPPRPTFRFMDRFNRLDCGAWLPGDREELERLGIRFFALHDGLYGKRACRVPGTRGKGSRKRASVRSSAAGSSRSSGKGRRERRPPLRASPIAPSRSSATAGTPVGSRAPRRLCGCMEAAR